MKVLRFSVLRLLDLKRYLLEYILLYLRYCCVRLITPVSKLVQCFDWACIVRVLTAVLSVRRVDTATLWIYQLFVFSVHSLLMSPA